MSNYTKSTNFATKDNLTPGDPLKVVRGTEIDTEYNNIATAIATKTDNASAAITGGAIDGATVGSTTPAAGAFTTLAASGTTTLAGALVGAATQAAFNTVSTTLNLGGAATAVNLGAATGTATVNNTTLAAKAITASTTLAVTGTSTLTGAVTATAGVTGPITSSSVSITGGSITGITDLAVADGGTGASTAAGGLNNLLPSQTGNANKYLQTDGTNASWDAVSLSTSDITGTLPVANGGTGVTSSTGTGNVVLSTSPTLVTPALGTPSALVGTNITGTASGLTAGNVTTNANLTGAVTSVGNATSLGSFTSAQLLGALTDETGTGSAVFATSPTLVTPILGTPTSATLTNATGLPISTGVSGLGTGVATALAVNVGSSGAPLVNGGVLGTPSSGTVTNLTGTASININGTVGATTASTGAFTTTTIGTSETLSYGTANGVTYLNGSKVLTSGSALTFDGTNFATSGTSTASKLIPTGTSVTGNGMYLPATNSLGFSTAGVNAAYIDANQNVGIGITPSAWRSAFNVTYGERVLELTYSALVTQAGPNTILANNVYFNSSNQWIYKNAVANTNAGLYTIGSNGVHSWSVAPTGASGAVATFTQAMTLDASGNLGVGTTSPINNSGYGGFSLNGTSGSLLSMMTGGTESSRIASISNETSLQCKASTGYITFVQGVSGGTERARIDSSGNLLVGTTSAGARVYAVASGSQQAIRGDQSTAGAAAIYGTSSVNSGTGYVAYFTNSGSGTGLYISNTAAWQSTSDERLKTDIQDLNATERLLQLRPRDYLWKSQETSDEPNKRSFGFIAQEVKEVFPELVGVSPDGMFSVEYTGLIAPLVKAIQEQQAIIESLKARLDAANL